MSGKAEPNPDVAGLLRRACELLARAEWKTREGEAFLQLSAEIAENSLAPDPVLKPCRTKKRRFPNEISARIALANRNARVVRAYRCPFCRGWHLISRPDRDGAERGTRVRPKGDDG